MPKIPQIAPSKESYISNYRLSTPGVSNIGVAKARPTQISGDGKDILAGILGDVGKSLKDVANVFAIKEETARVAKSQHLQLDINDTFRDLKIKASERTGDQVTGMLEEFKEAEEDFRSLNIPDDLNAKTTQELNQQFNREYNKHAAWIVNHTIQQSDIADKEARVRVIQNAHQNILYLTVGDSAGIEQEVIEAINFEVARHPNLTESQIETDTRALREDFVSFALTKWSVDNPTAAADFWDKNQAYLKKALPAKYPTMLKKIGVAKEDSAYDVAFATVQRLTNGDNAYAAKLIEEDDSGKFGLTAKQRLYLSSALRGIHTYEIAEEERGRRKKEEDYLMGSIDKYYDSETGVTNIREALADLEQARRRGTVDSTTYKTQKNNLLSGEKFSVEDSHILMREINDQEVTTQGEILNAIYGRGVSPEPYYNELKKRRDEITKGFTDNYFNEAEQRFTALTKITDPKDLPSGINEKSLLFDPADMPAFRRRLEAEARQLGYTAGDSRILDLAEDLMQVGWYSKTSPEFHPGEATDWLTIGERYLRKWEYNAAELFQKGEIHYIPEEETATGVSLTPDIQEIVKTIEGLEAYQRLLKEGIVPTEDFLKRAIEIIAKEKNK